MSDVVTEVVNNPSETTCLLCHWWFRFDKSLMAGDCVWHNGTKHTATSKLKFRGILKTRADFGCVDWKPDRREVPR